MPAWTRRFVDGDLNSIDPFLHRYKERGERWLFKERAGEGHARQVDCSHNNLASMSFAHLLVLGRLVKLNPLA